jgi:type IV pilus assembly protein PilM
MSFWEDRFVHRPHASAASSGSTGDSLESQGSDAQGYEAPGSDAPEIGHAWTHVSDSAADTTPAGTVEPSESSGAYEASVEDAVEPTEDPADAVELTSAESSADEPDHVEPEVEREVDSGRRGLFRRRKHSQVDNTVEDDAQDADAEPAEAESPDEHAYESVEDTPGDTNVWSSAPSFPEIAAEEAETEADHELDGLEPSEQANADSDADRWAAAAAAIEVEGAADVQHERRGLFRRRKPAAASVEDDAGEAQTASSGYDWGTSTEGTLEHEAEAFAGPEGQVTYGEAEQAVVDWDEQQHEPTELAEQPAVEHERRGLFRRRRPVAASSEDAVLDAAAVDADAEADASDDYSAEHALLDSEPVSTEAVSDDGEAWSHVETTDEPEVEYQLEDQTVVEDDFQRDLEPVADALEDDAQDEAEVTHERRGFFRRRKAVVVAESGLDDEAVDHASEGADESAAVEDDAFANVPMYDTEPTYASTWDVTEAASSDLTEPELTEYELPEPESAEFEPEPDYGVPSQIEVYAVADDTDAEVSDEPDVPQEAEDVDEATTAEDVELDAVEEFALEVADGPFESEPEDAQPFDVPVTSLQDEPVVARKRNGNSSSRGRKVVGLKVGASQIAAAVVTGSGDRPALVDIARRPLESGVVVDGELRDPEALAHALKTFFKDHGLPLKNVRLGISSSRVGVRSFDIIGIEDEERFDNAVRFKAHEVLPVAANESVLDYRVVEERYTESGEVARHVLLVVAPRDQVEPYIEACRTAGLRLAGVDLEAFGLLRAFVPPLGSRSRSEDSATVVVAVGHEASTLLVAGGGVCEFTRVFDWGGGALQAAIAEELEVPLMEAATILTHLSLSGPGRHLDSLDSDTRGRALEAVRTRLTPFARELVSSLQFYQTQPESLGIREILITGGTSHLEGLADALHQMIGVNVSVGDPLGRVTVQTEVPVALDATIGSLAVPIGLAIEDEATRSVNLLPKESRQARKSPNVLAVALPVGAAVVVAALAFLFVQASSTVGDRQSELDAVRAEIAKLPEPTRPNIDPALAGEQAQRATAVAQVLGGRLSWERVLGDVARVLPAGVSLTELSATAPPPTTPEPAATTEETSSTSSTTSTPPPAPAATTPSAPTGVIVTGYAFDYESIARALARLQTIPSLANAQLQSAVPANLGTKRVIEFTIVADLATTGGVQ